MSPIHQTLEQLDPVIAHSEKTLRRLYPGEFDTRKLFAYGMLDRIFRGAVQIRNTLENIVQQPDLEFAAGLTARALILDMLIGLNLALPTKQSDESAEKEGGANIQDFCDRTMADGI